MSPTTTHDGGATSPLEDRLRDALQTETTGVDASAAVWDAIRSAADTVVVPLDEARRSKGAGSDGGRGGDRRRGQALLLAVAACVAVALIVAGVVVARRDDGRDVYVGPTTTAAPNPGGTASTLVGPVSPPTSDLGRALWAVAGLRAALEEEQLATVAARSGLSPDAELRLVDARAATDAAASAFTEQALPRLGDGDTETAARQMAVSRMRNLVVIREAATRVGGDTATILRQYDETVEAIAVVGRIIAKQGGGPAAGTPAQREAATRTIQAAQLAEVPGQQAQWLASTSAALAARAAEDQPGPLDADIERGMELRRDLALTPESLTTVPGADDATLAILRATVAGGALPAETAIIDRLAAGQAPGGREAARQLLDQAEARLAELHRYEQALISRL